METEVRVGMWGKRGLNKYEYKRESYIIIKSQPPSKHGLTEAVSYFLN